MDGILQKITTNYTISGATLTFTSNPANLTEIEVKHMGVRGVLRRGTDYIYDAFTGDGSDTTFTLTHTVFQLIVHLFSIMVFVLNQQQTIQLVDKY